MSCPPFRRVLTGIPSLSHNLDQDEPLYAIRLDLDRPKLPPWDEEWTPLIPEGERVRGLQVKAFVNNKDLIEKLRREHAFEPVVSVVNVSHQGFFNNDPDGASFAPFLEGRGKEFVEISLLGMLSASNLGGWCDTIRYDTDRRH